SGDEISLSEVEGSPSEPDVHRSRFCEWSPHLARLGLA
ncbi:hypothetical protein A2U01_0073002, partial [Trifolium medium]|nr:hypothetical protein [Trifolium medium]